MLLIIVVKDFKYPSRVYQKEYHEQDVREEQEVDGELFDEGPSVINQDLNASVLKDVKIFGFS